MIVALWILTAVGVTLWSLFAWGLHSLLTLDPSRLDEINAAAGRLPYADWIERWLPGWQELLRLAVSLTQTALGWVGEVAPWVVWTTWGVGTFCMLGVAGLLAWAIKSATPLPIKSATSVAR